MIAAPSTMFTSTKTARSYPFDEEEYEENLSLSTTKRLRTGLEDHKNISISPQFTPFHFPYTTSLGSTEESTKDDDFWNLESISYCGSPCESEVSIVSSHTKKKSQEASKNFAYSVSKFTETPGSITIKLVRQKLSDCAEINHEEEDYCEDEEDYESSEGFFDQGESEYEEEEEEEFDFDEPFVFADDKYVLAQLMKNAEEETHNEEYISSPEL